MVWGILGALFGRGRPLPRDRTTKISRAAKKAAQPHVDGMQAAIAELEALDGLADVATEKRLPKGFQAAFTAFQGHYDRYIETVRKQMNLESAVVPGTAAGSVCCSEVPMGVTGAEAVVIYRTIRLWPDFPEVAKQLAAQGERQFNEIQSRYKGKDPAKIRMGSKPVQEGRIAYAAEGEPCAFADPKGRCRIWEQRPQSCRMHHVVSDPAWSHAGHENFAKVKLVNIRVPLRQQVALGQVEKRMVLGASPFLPATLMQIVQLVDGDMLYEVGEAPMRFSAQGTAMPRANRNRKGAKKFKGKSKGKGKKRR
ncbi:MAG: hypothetical protein ACPG77_06930 [Nannocystaceae bacterium]